MQELPRGWEIALFEDLLEYIQPTKYIVASTDYDDKYKTPVLTAGKSFIKGYTNETDGIFNLLPTIIFDDFTTATQFVNFPFKVKSSAMKILVPTAKYVNIKFVFYFMQTIHIHVDTHKRYWISHYSQLPTPLPPLPEQHRIVHKIEELFTKLDAGVEALKKIKAQLKRYRQAVLKHAFEGKLTQEWREANIGKIEPASVLLERIKEERKKEAKGKYKELQTVDRSELPVLPEGWVWTRLGQLACDSITKGSTPTSYGYTYKNEGIRFIKTENIDDNGYVRNITQFIDQETNMFLNRSILKTDDIFFSIAGTIGRVGLVQEYNLPANTNQALAIIRCFWDFVSNKFIFFFLKSPFIQSQALNSIVGVGRANISLMDVSGFPTPYAPLPEQKKIVEEIENRLSVVDELEKVIEQGLKQADRLRQSILKRAFEGKLVSQDPTDEPAKKLLERIKTEKAKREAEEKGKKRIKRKNQNQLELI